MKAVDVMTRNVVSVELDSSVFEAAQRMILNRISGLPVLDTSGKLVGVVTESDLLRRAETGTMRRRPSWLEFFLGKGRLATEYVRTHASKIWDLMTSDPQTIVEETPLDEIGARLWLCARREPKAYRWPRPRRLHLALA